MDIQIHVEQQADGTCVVTKSLNGRPLLRRWSYQDQFDAGPEAVLRRAREYARYLQGQSRQYADAIVTEVTDSQN